LSQSMMMLFMAQTMTEACDRDPRRPTGSFLGCER
jgi:hypothetical protein